MLFYVLYIWNMSKRAVLGLKIGVIYFLGFLVDFGFFFGAGVTT
jgi:hypothetical protein